MPETRRVLNVQMQFNANQRQVHTCSTAVPQFCEGIDECFVFLCVASDVVLVVFLFFGFLFFGFLVVFFALFFLFFLVFVVF